MGTLLTYMEVIRDGQLGHPKLKGGVTSLSWENLSEKQEISSKPCFPRHFRDLGYYGNQSTTLFPINPFLVSDDIVDWV